MNHVGPGPAVTASALLIAILCAGGCARGTSLGVDEAVEILVLDGLDRAQAECLVHEVEGSLDLAEVTGVDGDLDAAELERLFEASVRCRPAAAPGTSGVEGGSVGDLDDLVDGTATGGLDVEGVAAGLLRAGLDPDTAVCVAGELLGAPDPEVAVTDEARRLDAIAACENRRAQLPD